MHKQLQQMWEVNEQENDSQTEEELPTTLTESTKHKLKLMKIGTEEQEQMEREHQLDIDSYLQTQRINTKGNSIKARPKPKTSEQIEKEKEFKEGYGMGFKMLQKMGFNVTKGLGKNEQGRTSIVEAEFKTTLTTRDEDLQQQEAIRKRQQQQLQAEKSKINPFNELQYEELFLFRSRNNNINNLLMTLKNKYEVSKGKLDMLTKECDSFARDMRISESLRIQKANQVAEVQAQIEGLESISKSSSGIQKYPHLAIAYNADLLIVKETIEKLESKSIRQMAQPLKDQLRRTKDLLQSLFHRKQKQNLKQYGQVTAIEERFKKHLTKNQPNFQASQFLVFISEQDSARIQKYIRLIIEETLMKDKLQTYLHNLRDIEHCEDFIVDLMEIVREFSQPLANEIKQKFLIKLVNIYLKSWGLTKAKKLPHLAIFPWLMLLKLEQVDVNGLLYNVMAKMWPIETDQLYNLISPWLKHIKADQKAFFTNFYLAPRLLSQMEGIDLSSPSSKDKIKGVLKYCQLLPMPMRKQIIQNSLALTILGKYKSQLKKGESKVQDLNNWVIKWSQKFDGICEGVIKNVFDQNEVKGIW